MCYYFGLIRLWVGRCAVCLWVSLGVAPLLYNVVFSGFDLWVACFVIICGFSDCFFPLVLLVCFVGLILS